jgi:hypothetical protein
MATNPNIISQSEIYQGGIAALTTMGIVVALAVVLKRRQHLSSPDEIDIDSI